MALAVNGRRHLLAGMLKPNAIDPLRDAAGNEVGFMVCLEAENFSTAAAYAANSPYLRAGLYERSEIAHFAIEVGAGQFK